MNDQVEKIVWHKYPEVKPKDTPDFYDGKRYLFSCHHAPVKKGYYLSDGEIWDAESSCSQKIEDYWTILAWAELPKGYQDE